MTRVRFQITVSADGYVAGPNQSLENPLGERGDQLHKWAFATKAMREMHGMEGGDDTGTDNDIFREQFDNLGATIMGRHMFGGGDGAWDEKWRGWWDENPPYHTPVFVLTHHPRAPLPMEGGTTFHFVTDGMQAALDKAKRAAGAKDIMIAGGAKTAQQYLKAGLVDDMELHIVPVLLGSGARLFEDTGGAQRDFKLVRAAGSPAVAHFKYRR